MNADTITIKYDWEPFSTAHLGCQLDGAVCEQIDWRDGHGTVETWRTGSFDPSVYPVLEKPPFQLWRNAKRESR